MHAREESRGLHEETEPLGISAHRNDRLSPSPRHTANIHRVRHRSPRCCILPRLPPACRLARPARFPRASGRYRASPRSGATVPISHTPAAPGRECLLRPTAQFSRSDRRALPLVAASLRAAVQGRYLPPVYRSRALTSAVPLSNVVPASTPTLRYRPTAATGLNFRSRPTPGPTRFPPSRSLHRPQFHALRMVSAPLRPGSSSTRSRLWASQRPHCRRRVDTKRLAGVPCSKSR
jgi:hypothetical protein